MVLWQKLYQNFTLYIIIKDTLNTGAKEILLIQQIFFYGSSDKCVGETQ